MDVRNSYLNRYISSEVVKEMSAFFEIDNSCMVRYIQPDQHLALPRVREGDVAGMNPKTPLLTQIGGGRDTSFNIM